MATRMHPRRSRMTIRVAVLLALIGLLTAPRGLVLCVGDAGHVSLEGALELVSCQTVSDDSKFETEPTETCSDTPLLSEVLKSPVELKVIWTSFTILSPTLRLVQVRQSFRQFPSRALASSLWLREHRTIVLLV